MKKIEILFCLILLFIFISFRNINAQSTPTPSSLYDGHYSAGVMNIRDFSTPPPGINFVNYNIFTSATKFYDRNGNEITSYIGPTGTRTQLSLDLNGYTNVLVMLYASPKIKSLGGMQYIGGIMPAYTTVSTELASYRIGLIDTIPPESGIINGGVNGFADFSFMPLCLSWHSDVFVFTTAYKTYAPTGKYSTGGDGNIGLGYWTHQVQVFGFLNPMKVKGKPSKAMAIMFAGTLELNSKIKDVDVTPGSRFSVEYGFSQYLNPKLEVGIMGGSNFQIGEDHGSAVWWDKSVKDQKSYISFQLAYWIFPQLYASAKYTFNYGLKQRISQNVYQLNLTFPTGLLSGQKKKK